MRALLWGVLYFASLSVFPQGKAAGVLIGRVVEKPARAALAGVQVTIVGTTRKTFSDADGRFRFYAAPAGSLQLFLEKDGYLPVLAAVSVVSREQSPSPLEVEMERLREEVTVVSRLEDRKETLASSREHMNGSEVRRLPGTLEDINRALQVIPGVATAGDFKNDLIVRGGSPVENLFLVGPFEVRTISHFGSQGSGGGAFGLLDARLVRDVEFLSGGFPVYYGDKLSSATRIELRDGNRDRLAKTINLSLFGLAATLEGPLFSERGSWLVSGRMNYIQAISRELTEGMNVRPEFFDVQMKMTYDVGPRHQLTLLALGSEDDFKIEDPENTAAQTVMAMGISGHQNLAGLSLKNLFGEKGFTLLNLSRLNHRYSYHLDNRSGRKYATTSDEAEWALRFDLDTFLSAKWHLVAGASWKRLQAEHDLFYRGGYTIIEGSGYRYPRQNISGDLSAEKWSGYGQVSAALVPRLNLTAGVRADYMSYIGRGALSPRLGLSYDLSRNVRFHASYGVFHQSPETLWLSVHADNWNLRFLRAEHAVAGLEYEGGSALKLKAEIFQKTYSGYPVDTRNPYITLANSGGSVMPTFFGSKLVSAGKGQARGAELSLRKEFWGRLDLIVDYSYSVITFTALDGVARAGDFDFRHILNAVAECRPWKGWSTSFRVRLSGGAPYTPYDIAYSEQRGSGYFDLTRINTLRYPSYSRLDLRLEKEFRFKTWVLSTYIDIQNLTNRKNVYLYVWDDGEIETFYYLPVLPLLGIRVDF